MAERLSVDPEHLEHRGVQARPAGSQRDRRLGGRRRARLHVQHQQRVRNFLEEKEERREEKADPVYVCMCVISDTTQCFLRPAHTPQQWGRRWVRRAAAQRSPVKASWGELRPVCCLWSADSCVCYLRGVITSGGGFSIYNARPSWQNSAVSNYFSAVSGSSSAPVAGYNSQVPPALPTLPYPTLTEIPTESYGVCVCVC